LKARVPSLWRQFRKSADLFPGLPDWFAAAVLVT
jgi:hypothetical protein